MGKYEDSTTFRDKVVEDEDNVGMSDDSGGDIGVDIQLDNLEIMDHP
jgi:hypothetical protein